MLPLGKKLEQQRRAARTARSAIEAEAPSAPKTGLGCGRYNGYVGLVLRGI